MLRGEIGAYATLDLLCVSTQRCHNSQTRRVHLNITVRKYPLLMVDHAYCSPRGITSAVCHQRSVDIPPWHQKESGVSSFEESFQILVKWSNNTRYVYK